MLESPKSNFDNKRVLDKFILVLRMNSDRQSIFLVSFHDKLVSFDILSSN